MNFISNLTALFTPANAAVQSKPVFRGTSAAPFQSEVGFSSDSYTTNPLYSMLGNEAEILKAAQNSEFIRNHCKEYGIPLRVNLDILEDMR